MGQLELLGGADGVGAHPGRIQGLLRGGVPRAQDEPELQVDSVCVCVSLLEGVSKVEVMVRKSSSLETKFVQS